MAGAPASPPRPTMRLDKWLWQARFFKTRTLAARAIEAGEVRLNAVRVVKPAHAVTPGDTLTFIQGGRVRVIRCTALAVRRGPATEAQGLYDDLAADEGGKDRRSAAEMPPHPLE